MTTWQVGSDRARIRGAIGIFYPWSATITAETAEQAEAQFRERYETIAPVRVIASEPEHVGSVRRYTVTHIDQEGMRRLTFDMQGRHTWTTPEEAEEQLRSLQNDNSSAKLASVYGPQAIGTFEVRPVSCYPRHFDPMGMWFD